MNRIEHLQSTLIKNIEDNISYGDVEFILLDYNSSDGLEDWVKSVLKNYIDNGILKYYRTNEPTSFHRSHSRNIALKLGSGDIVCNVDADNFLGNDFAYYINYEFSFNQNIFLTSGVRDGSYGRICVKKDDFLRLSGYDEKMTGWGYEDDDLYDRLSLIGKERKEFIDKNFTEIIEHDIENSFDNDKNVSDVQEIYIQQLAYNHSVILFLLKNNLFKYGILTKQHDYSEIELVDYWRNGVLIRKKNVLNLKFDDNSEIKVRITSQNNFQHKKNPPFYLVTNELLKNKILINLTALQNKKLYHEKKEQNALTNNKNWGKALLTYNFNEKIEI
jgi:hypothetical protein